MHYGLQMLERTEWEERVHSLETKFNDMHSDFAKCAKDNIPPCFFCENDEICNGCPDNCNFKWHAHN
jgi:hypothetical protein